MQAAAESFHPSQKVGGREENEQHFLLVSFSTIYMSGLFIHLFYVFSYFAYMYVYEPHACLPPVEARRGCPGPLVTDGHTWVARN